MYLDHYCFLVVLSLWWEASISSHSQPHTVEFCLTFSFLFVGDFPGHNTCFWHKTNSISFILYRAHYTY